jgi:hypothetical protein
MTLLSSLCEVCKHIIPGYGNNSPTCEAFTEGIPEEIWTNKVKHTNPYPGDKGIRFEPAYKPQKDKK